MIKNLNLRMPQKLYDQVGILSQRLKCNFSEATRHLLTQSLESIDPSDCRTIHPQLVAQKIERQQALTTNEFEYFTRWVSDGFQAIEDRVGFSSDYCLMDSTLVKAMTDGLMILLKHYKVSESAYHRAQSQLSRTFVSSKHHHDGKKQISNQRNDFLDSLQQVHDQASVTRFPIHKLLALAEQLIRVAVSVNRKADDKTILLNELSPYLCSLLCIAKWGFHLNTPKQPQLHFVDKKLFAYQLFSPFIKNNSTHDTLICENMAIDIEFNERMRCFIRRDRRAHKAIQFEFTCDFLQLQDLYYLLTMALNHQNHTRSYQSVYFSLALSDKNNGYYFSSNEAYSITLGLTEKEVKNLLSLLEQVKTKYAYPWQQLSLQWGAWSL